MRNKELNISEVDGWWEEVERERKTEAKVNIERERKKERIRER